jgi:hypothetical protein
MLDLSQAEVLAAFSLPVNSSAGRIPVIFENNAANPIRKPTGGYYQSFWIY